MTYDEALNYIHGISWTFCKPGLERIRELCAGLKDPQRELKFIHVAGTNGKGSFCSMISRVLTASGYRVGLYTSPFVLRFNERMQIDGVPIDDAELAALTEEVKPIAEKMTDKPTEFELITAIALLYFKRNCADIVVFEAGMGGRLDSTNVIDASLLSVITGIALDHTAFLGDTVEKIAAEKAGIIKHGCPVLYGGENESVRAIITERACELSAPSYTVRPERLSIKAATLDGSVFDYGEYKDIHLSLLGLYQPRNAINVLESVEILRTSGLNIPDSAVREALSNASWPARFEIIKCDPTVIFDGAHNPEGISAAVRSIRHYFEKTGVIAVSGVLRDKDYGFIAGELATVCKRVYTITPDSPRALDAEKFAEVIEANGVSALPRTSVGAALDAAIEDARLSGLPVVCLGSLYTYAEVINHLRGNTV